MLTLEVIAGGLGAMGVPGYMMGRYDGGAARVGSIVAAGLMFNDCADGARVTTCFFEYLDR
tara:strand:+ start:8425 stop:8607 length:183 start_codon:yes stop_codon:yes gene_type:complete